ncbi:MAG: guanylate cyclase [Ignavibacteria bacterium CG2_30_36_16]|nr:GAF domain-containing protein [Ignavibacteria bacterium]OIP57432.1 MAG: guanylate cyclase [Ignavibacteria bacterium CG2_30_36_16]PJB01935.1 MAG: guanylate cyclase [Ignavibacteria bacterium CG_4_9_14_3_um_filter_36_18]
MAENLFIEKNLSLEEKYKTLETQLRVLLNKDENEISNLSNFTAALKETFDKISWVGFYIFDDKKLFLGPFQGKVACTSIEIGRGVCGAAAEKLETIIVPDVNSFNGHIACDTESKSEIVVPIIKDKKLWGVLDLDSTAYNSFNATDKIYLEIFCKFLSEKII